MSKQEARAKGYARKEPYNVVYDALFGALGNLHAAAVKAEGEFIELRVKQRGYADWLAIAKRVGADGGSEVIFGVGHDLVSALLGLNGAMAANRWRPDRPYKPGG